MANKNSTYVQSLVSFILDTKPYHSKLTEIVEEYRFSDEMLVNVKDTLFSSVMTKGAWAYSHFADGNSVPSPLTPIHRVLTPQFRGMTANNQPDECRGAFKVGRDEITDLPLVPYAFDPTSIQGVGLADALVQRYGYSSNSEALLEGKDVFLSHGAYVFQITRTKNTQNLYSPQFVERRNEGVISAATMAIQAHMLDRNNPNSAINKIQDIVDLIRAKLTTVIAPNAETELAAIQTILDSDNLPRSYENLISELKLFFAATPVLPGYNTWDDVVNVLQTLSPGLHFNSYTDLGVREGGELSYYDVLDRQDMNVSDIVVSPDRDTYDELVFRGVGTNGYVVSGSHSGVIGAGTVPGAFSSANVSFTTSAAYRRTFGNNEIDPYPFTVTLPFGSQGLNITGDAEQLDDNVIQINGPGEVTASLPMDGVEFTIAPHAKITVHQDAISEAWSIIKVNPLAYSRPVLNSTRYGYIKNAGGNVGYVTINDHTFPTSTVILTALDSETFSVTCTALPEYSAIAQVGQLFSDSRLTFTIVQGSAYAFQTGDKFYVEITNELPKSNDLELYFGYDLSPYDGGDHYVYDAVNAAVEDYLKSLDFGYDSRFIGYEASSLGLQIAPNAIGDRHWRLRAVPNLNTPLPQRAPADNRADLTAGESAPVYDADGNGTPDIKLYYADRFALEYSDDEFSWITVAPSINIGSTYTSSTHGISFKIVQPSKPFIGVVVTDTTGEVQGGDVFLWSVQNKDPIQTEPSGLTSPRAPRLIMHGDSYHDSVPATWALEWTSQGHYTLQGVYSTGPNTGQTVFYPPDNISFIAGKSYYNRELGLHWTVVPGAVGLTNGDSFTFETFDEKPMFLVHGSVSGWQEPATMDKYYWNGKIGFKINSPDVALFEGDTKIDDWMSSYGEVRVEWLRRDVESTVYTLRSHVNGHWVLYRNGEPTAEGTSVLQDKHIRIAVPSDVPAGALLRIDVVGTGYDMSLGHDLAIIKTSPGRTPTSNDFVVFNRTKSDDVKISIKAKDDEHALALSPLGLTTVDIRFADHNTGSGVPLSVTSPETAVLPGWIPALLTKFDNTNSLAEFSDTATTLVARAAATGEIIGTVKSLGETPVEPVVFEWNSDFAAKYLPLNAEATIVTYGSGMNDRVQVNMTEGVAFFLGGGGLADNVMFNDQINIQIEEGHDWKIKSAYNTDLFAVIVDTGFTGFLPGYDNLPYDEENGVDGYYDAGQALTADFEVARRLALQNVLTPQEQALLNDLKSRLQPYTLDPATMTLEQFLAALDAEPPVNYITSAYGFGIPDVGLGMQVEQSDLESTAAQIADTMVIKAIDTGYQYDAFGYDVGPLDSPSDSTVIMYSNSGFPIPSSGLPTSGTYESFVTELHTPTPTGRIVEVAFSSAVIGTPQFYIWLPDESLPRPINVVEKVSSRQFRFTLPAPSEFKLIIV